MRPRPALGGHGTPVLLLFGYLVSKTLAGNVLSSSGFTSCLPNSTVTVNTANVQYDRTSGVVDFDVAGTSSKEQNVTASLIVTAYGTQVYQKSFNPCDPNTKVTQLCPGL